MKLLPWVCVAGLVIGLGWVYSAGQKKGAELAALREESQQLQALRAEVEETRKTGVRAESDELVRLRKDREELLRLRNEVRQLRSDKQQLATQVQTAQARVQSAQEQIQALRANPGQPAVPGQPDAAAQAAFRARYGLPPAGSEQDKANACINNLRVIDGAKQQWALENRKAADLSPYLKGNAVPVCPAGGIYTLNAVGLVPICNIPGHALPK